MTEQTTPPYTLKPTEATTTSLPVEVKLEPVKKAEPKKVDKLYALLSQSIPEEWQTEYEEDGKIFTGYKSQYAINLLNEVVGAVNWWEDTYIVKVEQVGRGFICSTQVTITIKYNDFTYKHDGLGGAYAKDIGNAMKGAKTSAFKNACRYFGIGKELYENVDDDIIQVETSGEAEVVVPEEAKNIEERINAAKSVEQLESLESVIKAIESKGLQALLAKKYNKKKLTLVK